MVINNTMKKYSKHYLMIKTHNITGLKYLCKTSTDNKLKCFTYKGSGTYWKKHLSKHGDDISTIIIEECDSKRDLTEKGIYWSKRLNVVESADFANLIEERGDGGPTMLGRQITKEQKIKQGKAISEFYCNSSKEYKILKTKINSLSHAIKDKKMYVTPAGEFLTCTEATVANGLGSTGGGIKKHCIDGFNNNIVNARKLGRDIYLKKTWRELGYNIRDISQLELEYYTRELNNYKIKLKHAKLLGRDPRRVNVVEG